MAVVLLTAVQCKTQGSLRRRTPEERAKFQAWRAKFKRNYTNDTEEEDAMEKVLTNREKIEAHNKLHDEGKVTFRQALWKHSDLSDSEKRNVLMGLQVPPETRSAPVVPSLPIFPPGPESLDWRKTGLVGPVHDQGLN